jgi:predicted short-subunit dehydrogenase-like oxidoreductase (DUF2520 family)
MSYVRAWLGRGRADAGQPPNATADGSPVGDGDASPDDPGARRADPTPAARGAAVNAQAHGHAPTATGQTRDLEALPRIGFVGAGRVGLGLGIAFARAGWPVVAVASRDAQRRARFQAALPAAQAYAEPAAVLDDVNVVFVTVPDDAIAEVAGGLRLYSGQAMVHTSGLHPASILASAQAAGTMIGSFHPLVAFADPEEAASALVGATVALDGDEPLVQMLAELAEAVGAQPVRLPSAGKPAYHAAAMLAAGGFVALLDAIAELGRGAGLDERQALAIYAPLVRQTLDNATRLGIASALTGPIVRGDEGTLRAHLQAMAELAPGARELYVAAARREVALAEGRGELAPEPARRMRRLLDEAF